MAVLIQTGSTDWKDTSKTQLPNMVENVNIVLILVPTLLPVTYNENASKVHKHASLLMQRYYYLHNRYQNMFDLRNASCLYRQSLNHYCFRRTRQHFLFNIGFKVQILHEDVEETHSIVIFFQVRYSIVRECIITCFLYGQGPSHNWDVTLTLGLMLTCSYSKNTCCLPRTHGFLHIKSYLQDVKGDCRQFLFYLFHRKSL